MKKFNFHLSPLLKLRKRQEDVTQKILNEAYASLQQEISLLEKLEREKKEIDEELKKKRAVSSRIDDIIVYLQYLEMLILRISRQEDVLIKERNVVEDKRMDVVKAMRERQIIEKIREKKYAVWKEGVRRMEVSISDEEATMNYNNRKQESLADE